MSNHLEGRFYEAEFPELEEVVVVQVKRIVEMGAYASLLEYNGREGMMLLSELSKRRIRSVSKLLRVGRNELCLVHRLDVEKGYIDLSKRRVAPEDAIAKEEQFAKAKAVHGIMRHVAMNNDIPVEELCSKVAWPLYNSHGNAHDALRKHINGELDVWEQLDFSQPGMDLSHLADKIKEEIEVDLRRKLFQQMLRMRAKIEVSCSGYEGIDAIRESLLKGLEASTDECDVKIKLIAHPQFALSCMCRDKVQGLQTIEKAMSLIETTITEKGGVYCVRTAAEVVGNDDPQEAAGSHSGSDSDGDSSSDAESHMGELDEDALKELEKRVVDDCKDDNDGA